MPRAKRHRNKSKKSNNSSEKTNDDQKKLIKEATESMVEKGGQIFGIVVNYVRKNPEFTNKKDKDRMDFFTSRPKSLIDYLHTYFYKKHKNYKNKSEYEQNTIINNNLDMIEAFCKECPIQAKYMIIFGQYSKKAMSLYLHKLASDAKNFQGKSKEEKQDLWIRRQADYIKLLYQYCEKHYNPNKAVSIWHQAYKTLKGEMETFKNTYDESEKKVTEREKKNNLERAEELRQRLINGQKLPSDKEELLRKKALLLLDIKVFKNKLAAVHKEITARGQILHTCEAVGTAAPVNSDKPVVTMIASDKYT